MRPLAKLLSPLFHRHIWTAKYYCRLLNMTWSYNSSQCFACTTRQHNDARPSPTITEHFRKSLLLIVSYNGCRLYLNFEVRCRVVFLKVIFFDQGQLLRLTILFNLFYVFAGYLKLSLSLYPAKFAGVLRLSSRYLLLGVVPFTQLQIKEHFEFLFQVLNLFYKLALVLTHKFLSNSSFSILARNNIVHFPLSYFFLV